jgi:purine-binding chemotaxis protein CheW
MPDAADLLLFELGHQRFALPLAEVREVVRAVSQSRLPRAPEIIEGVINLRGRTVPVLDIRARFRLAAKPVEPADHMVIAHAGPRLVALRVDRALGLLHLGASEIDPVESLSPYADYVAGVGRLPDGLVLIHDLASFLSQAEAAALAGIEEEVLP